VIDARELDDATTQADDEVARIVATADGFAQVLPEHKYRIVRALQATGHIVGMTGDGVNDAPALKQADAGIAVSGATDAARAAADVVLLAPGLSVIVEAIRRSREIFERMTSYAIYRIAETIRVLLLISISIVVFNFFPVTPVMIVLLALLNDGAILSIAYDRADPAPRPVHWQMRDVLTIATALGVAGVVASFGLFAFTHRVLHLDDGTVRTIMYLKLSFLAVPPRADPARRRVRHPARRDAHRRLRRVHDADRLGGRRARVALRARVPRGQRRGEGPRRSLAPDAPGESVDDHRGREGLTRRAHTEVSGTLGG
jgi:magnesium-transporting ATPase (P-type)